MKLGHSGESVPPAYRPLKSLGCGSFGVVYLAEEVHSGEEVAIKEVQYDPRLHNREVHVLSGVLHQLYVTPSTAPSSPPYSPARPTGHPSSCAVCAQAASSAAELSSPGAERQPTPKPPPVWRRTHPNLLCLHACHHVHRGTGDRHGEGGVDVLQMVLDYVPSDIHRYTREFFAPAADGAEDPSRTTPHILPLTMVKLILFQAARGLAYMHAHHTLHRDLKPANILIDPATAAVKLCDFGSAKQILQPRRERNVSYICSRFYRAPELLFGALHYDAGVDMWSLGCLAAELLRDGGRVLFKGCTTVDQMAELFKVLGSPSREEMMAMNPQCAEALLRTHAAYYGDPEKEGLVDGGSEGSRCPTSATFTREYDILRIRGIPYEALFPPDTPTSALDLVASLLCYHPGKRASAVDVVEHAFFEDLFATSETEDDRGLRLPNGSLFPVSAFELTQLEATLYTPALVEKMTHTAATLQRLSRKE